MALFCAKRLLQWGHLWSRHFSCTARACLSKFEQVRASLQSLMACETEAVSLAAHSDFNQELVLSDLEWSRFSVSIDKYALG